MGRIRIGVSGCRYTPWRGNFYPKKLAQARELEHASRVFPSIELNGSFYSLQRPSSYAQWAQATPPGFVFAVKGGRHITHMLRLRNAETAIANFFASGLFELGDKLGPILWQFSPNMAFEPELFEAFFRLLPKTTATAAVLARQRDTDENRSNRRPTTACATRSRCGMKASSTRHSSRCCASTGSPGSSPTRPGPGHFSRT